jgi:cytochrome oxidase Cu insertion factor (SCO1/SenC/PrrC family)
MRNVVHAVARPRALPLAFLVLAACAPGSPGSGSSPTNVRYGTPAADFSLVDQFGQTHRLSDFRGETVLLAFIDPRCTALCPLTAELLRRTKDSLGGDPPVQLLAIDANPQATRISDVHRWSERHGMLHQWLFLTAPLRRLARTWSSYGVVAKVQGGDVAHTSVIFVIDGSDRERGVFPIASASGIQAEVAGLAEAVRRVS